MLVATILDNDNRIGTYIHVNNKNNKLVFSGYNITQNGITNLKQDSIIELFDFFKLSNNKTKINNYLEYTVYLDNESGLKHYFKNGEEDFFALFKYNGKDAVAYKNQVNNEEENIQETITSKILEFFHKNERILASIQLALFLKLLSIAYDFYNTTYVDYGLEIGMFCYDDSGEIVKNNKIDTYEEIRELINNSPNLLQEDKEYLLNSDLFKDVLPYYPADMSYWLNLKLNNLTIKYYEKYESEVKDKTVIGYYNITDPNVINGKTGVDKEDYLGHEFFHLLQYPYLKFNYIKEATADIGAYEYFGDTAFGYPAQTQNIRMLMDVIGPKVIWNYIFSGDDTELIDILKDNLSDEDYNNAIEILQDAECGRDDELTEIISRLYKNMYNSDIKDNHDIFSFANTFINGKIYFNESKMKEKETYTISYDYWEDKATAENSEIYKIYYIKPDSFEKFKGQNTDKSFFATKVYSPLDIKIDYIVEDGFTLNMQFKDGEVYELDTSVALEGGICEELIAVYAPETINLDTYKINVNRIERRYIPRLLTDNNIQFEILGSKIVVSTNNILTMHPEQRIREEEHFSLTKKFY